MAEFLGSVLRRSGRFLFTLGRDHLGTGFTGGLGFRCHRTLQLYRQTHVLTRKLHATGDCHSLAEDFVQMPGAHGVAKRGLRQQPGRVMSVFDVRNRHGGIRHTIVHYGVHRHGDAVLDEQAERHREDDEDPG
uniref:Uncharacterized protein n=1 Tax=Anopheles farauti TaxID=69004 RepID=A0A182QJ40_9DIPT